MLTVSLALCALGAVLSWPGPARRWARPRVPSSGRGGAPSGHAARGAVARIVHSVRRRAVPGRWPAYLGVERSRAGLTSGRGASAAGAEVAAAVAALAAGLRAGLPTVAAARAALGGATAPGAGATFLAVVAAAASSGDPVGPRLTALARDSPDLAFLAQAWVVAERTGAPLAPTLTSAARDIRAALARQRRLAVLAAGPRATMHLLTVLPLLGPLAMMGLAGLDRPWSTPVARSAVLAGVVLLWLGRRWAAWMIRRALRPPGVPDPTGAPR
ncbi:MAG: type II secretion system F family protein [Dermatophilaceae bacterium]